MATDVSMEQQESLAAISFEALLWQPGLIWGCTGEECLSLTNDFARLDGPGFRWLHLNLADGRTHGWLEREDRFPAEVHELLLSREDHPRAVIDKGGWASYCRTLNATSIMTTRTWSARSMSRSRPLWH